MDFYAFYLVLSNKFGTFAAERWNRFRMVSIVSDFKRMLKVC